jgi:hypothetical protein
MARRPRVTETSVAKLGVDRLAALLVAEAAKHKALKQALQLALEADQGVASLTAGIRQRLITIGKSESRLSTNKGREMLGELKRLQASLVSEVADADPAEALSLMWQMIDLHRSLIARTRDRAGRMNDFFSNTITVLPEIAARANPDAEQLANDIYQRYVRDPFGIFTGLITEMAEPLGPSGLAVLRDRLLGNRRERIEEHQRLSSSARIDHMLSILQTGLRDVADATGDADAFVETFSADELRRPDLVSQAAMRLASCGRAEEAIAMLNHAQPDSDDQPDVRLNWADARAMALAKLSRLDELKELHWEMFETFLNADHLRAYLKLLPDFDDVEAEERALDWVMQHPAFNPALLFLVRWKALPRATKLVDARATEIDGDYYELLMPAAESLDGKFPLAGALLRRALIAHTLEFGRSHRFKQAMQHVRELEALHAMIADYGDHDDHKAFMEHLWLDHPHKSGFWSLLE